MKFFLTYLSTAPLVAALSLGFITGFIIEMNRFFPDGLVFPAY